MDNYVLVERLGQGSFAIVWKARRKSDNRLVAVKQLRQAPSTWEECKRLPEIRAAAAVRGPHIIALLEAVRHGNELFLVFEYADSDLYRCLGPSSGRRFEEPQVRWVMRQLLSALAAVHGAGLVHCDVKPENLLLFARLGPYGEAVLKLCDLGQATPAGEVASYVGTRWYRSPELLLGLERQGCEIDLWAAGCFMAELLLLRPPFPGTDTRDMLFRICSALGAPQEGWHLSERLMQASGLRFAPSAAEGPLWFELSSTGASSSAVELVRALLPYDQNKRMPAARAIHTAFLGSGAPEAPVTLSEDRGRMRTVEGLQRSRDEAKAVERKIQAKSGARPQHGSAFGFGGAGFGGGGGLGIAGGLAPVGASFGAPAHGQAAPLMSSSSASSLASQELRQGFTGGVLNGPSTSSTAAAAGEPGTMRRHQTEKTGLPSMAAANRRAVQERRAVRGQMAPSSSMSGLAPLPGLQQRPSSSKTDFREAAPREKWISADPLSPTSTPSVSPQRQQRSRLGVPSDESGAEGGDDDEELAALFWSQVEHSRAAAPGADMATSSTSNASHVQAGYSAGHGILASAGRAESSASAVHFVSRPSDVPTMESGYNVAGNADAMRPRRRNRSAGTGGASSASSAGRESEASAWEPPRGPAVVCAVAGSVPFGSASAANAPGSSPAATSENPESLDPADLLDALGDSPPSVTAVGSTNGFFPASSGPRGRSASAGDDHVISSGGYTGGPGRGVGAIRGGAAGAAPVRQASERAFVHPGVT